ncbi:MAG: transcription repressor NadR [Lachnospiraceae bacterium]|nr:transcription repressor NadR [Lachnospiraceae bacterium]
MKGEARRQEIIEILSGAKEAVSGNDLAKRLGVSRQVIVQDMALLRTSYRNIISTNKGYLLYEESPKREWFRREVRVRHGREDIVRELDCIVDAGGWVVDVIVEHEIYGRLSGELVIRSRADVREFMRRVEEYQTKPLTELTEGVHLHTIEAEREETLNAVERALAEAGFLVTIHG